MFAENGLVAFKEDQLIAKQSLRTHLGEDRIKEFVNFILRYVSGGGRHALLWLLLARSPWLRLEFAISVTSVCS